MQAGMLRSEDRRSLLVFACRQLLLCVHAHGKASSCAMWCTTDNRTCTTSNALGPVKQSSAHVHLVVKSPLYNTATDDSQHCLCLHRHACLLA